MKNYTISNISSKEGKDFICHNHYTHGCNNCPMCYGLFEEGVLIGACAFAIPCSETVRSYIFGKEQKSHVIELHRLFIFDITPKNTESWFVSRVLKMLKEDRPDIWAVVSFADGTENHRGVIYQALNAMYYGLSRKAIFYRDSNGRLRHPRQNGVNIKVKEALEKGWVPESREGKHRYLWLLAKDKRELSVFKSRLLIKTLPYPT